MMDVRKKLDDYFHQFSSAEWWKLIFFGFGAFGVTLFVLFASKIIPPQLDVLQFPTWYENFTGVATLVVLALLLLNQYVENFIFRNVITCRSLFIFLALCAFFSMFPKTGYEVTVYEFIWGLLVICMFACLYFRTPHKTALQGKPQTA